MGVNYLMARRKRLTYVGNIKIRINGCTIPTVIVDEIPIEHGLICSPSFNSNGEEFFRKVASAEPVEFFMYPILDQESAERVPQGKKPVLGSKETGLVTFNLTTGLGCFFELSLVASAVAPKEELLNLIRSIPGASSGLYRDSPTRLTAKKIQERIESEGDEDFWGWGLIKFVPRDTPFTYQ
jgi:hypothetical protein